MSQLEALDATLATAEPEVDELRHEIALAEQTLAACEEALRPDPERRQGHAWLAAEGITTRLAARGIRL